MIPTRNGFLRSQ